MDNLENKIYKRLTKHEEGFTNHEIKSLLEEYPSINMDKFYNAMRGNTCMVIDGEVISYHHDVLLALKCGLENRSVTLDEWD